MRSAVHIKSDEKLSYKCRNRIIAPVKTEGTPIDRCTTRSLIANVYLPHTHSDPRNDLILNMMPRINTYTGM